MTKRVKILKGLSEAVNQRTDNTMTKSVKIIKGLREAWFTASDKPFSILTL
jgi:hypothetical protein